MRPVLDAPVNKGHLCVKGRYGWDFVHAADRVTQPMIRSGDAWQSVIVGRSHRISSPSGCKRPLRGMARMPSACSARRGPRTKRTTSLRSSPDVVIGTNNVDCCARVCHAPTAAGMKLMLGTGAATNSFDDIEHGPHDSAVRRQSHGKPSDRRRSHQAGGARGAELIVIDPRRIELADFATLHLQLRPGTNIPLLNAIAHVIVDEKLYDPSVVPEHVEEWDKYCRFIDELAAGPSCAVFAA